MGRLGCGRSRAKDVAARPSMGVRHVDSRSLRHVWPGTTLERLQLGLATSTVHRVLQRWQLNRLQLLDRVTRAPIRYQHPAPGDLLHIDVKRLRRIPKGGGRRFGEVSRHLHRAPSLSVATSCTSPSTTTAATCTWRSPRTRAGLPRRPSWIVHSRTSARWGSSCSASSPTTAATSCPQTSALWPISTPSGSGARGPIGHRPTAKQNA